MNKPNDVALGDKVKDVISGLKGIAVARATHLTGCDMIFIEPTIKHSPEKGGSWVDEDRVQIVQAGAVTLPSRSEKPGGQALPPPKTR